MHAKPAWTQLRALEVLLAIATAFRALEASPELAPELLDAGLVAGELAALAIAAAPPELLDAGELPLELLDVGSLALQSPLGEGGFT